MADAVLASDIFPNLTPAEAARYLELQAGRTAAIRMHLYRKIGIAHMNSVLEVGCGGGAVLRELQEKVPFAAGLDPSPYAGLKRVGGGVGERLPFKPATFQALFFHYALLWVPDMNALFAEVRRVLSPGGIVVLLAEPLIGEVGGADGEAFKRMHDGAGIHTFTFAGLNTILREHGLTPALERAVEDATSEAEWDTLNAKLLGRRMELKLPLAYGVASI